MIVCDSHCHFFSAGFFRTLAKDLPPASDDAADTLPATLGWQAPGTDEALADRWLSELDRHGVARAMLIASVPGDEASIATAAARHPGRIVSAFMFNPNAPDTDARIDRAFGELGLRTACLFPAMHGYSMDDETVAAVCRSAERHRRAVFVHCGLLSVGVRRKLGLPSRFDLRKADPLAVAAIAVHYPGVPFVIPHFGAGLFREALMAADSAPNIVLDTSSSNSWIKFTPGLTLRDAFARALDCVGPNRLLFGTDSSFFPRGWHAAVFEGQQAILADLGVDEADRQLVFGGNFLRVFDDARPAVGKQAVK
jgi:predicted TIM-barrel fold metal-dependent hydrolase